MKRKRLIIGTLIIGMVWIFLFWDVLWPNTLIKESPSGEYALVCRYRENGPGYYGHLYLKVGEQYHYIDAYGPGSFGWKDEDTIVVGNREPAYTDISEIIGR